MLITASFSKKDDYKDIDRRKFTRLDHSLNVNFSIVNGKDDSVITSSMAAVTRNISVYGICLESTVVTIDGLHISYHSSMMYKNSLKLEIFLNENECIHALGEVSWYNKVDKERGYLYEAGVCFTEISEDDLQKIKDIVK